jgi:hypothetical protein
MSKPSLDDLLKSVREDGKKEDPKKAARKKALEKVPVSKPTSKAQRDREQGETFSKNLSSSQASAQKADAQSEKRKTLAAKMERRKNLQRKKNELETKKREGEERKNKIKSAVNAASSGPSISSGSNMEKGGPSAEKQAMANAGKAVGGAVKAIATATGLDKKAEKAKKKLGNKLNPNRKKGLATGVASTGRSKPQDKKPSDPWEDKKPKDPWAEQFSHWREELMIEVDEKTPKSKDRKIEPMKGTNIVIINPDSMKESLDEGFVDNFKRGLDTAGQRFNAFVSGAGRPNIISPEERKRLRDAEQRRKNPSAQTGGGPNADQKAQKLAQQRAETDDAMRGDPRAPRPTAPAPRPAGTPPRPAASAPKPKPMTADQKSNAKYQALRTKDPAAAKKLGMDIWKNKYKDTLAKNVKSPTTPSMANQAAELKRSGLNSPESKLTTANATINSLAKSPRAKQILSGTGKSPTANAIGTNAVRTSAASTLQRNSVEYSDWRNELDEVYMLASPKKNKETPKKKETWYERDERKAKEKKLRKEEVQFSNWRDSFIPTDYEFTDLIKPDPIKEGNAGPSTPVKYDSGMKQMVPNQGAGRVGKVRLKPSVTASLQQAQYEPEEELTEKKRGLWDNIHAKRKRGEKPAKPGDEGYPKTLNVEGMSLKDFKANRQKNKRREDSADAEKRGHVGKEWHNTGRKYSPDEAKRSRANMDDEERRTRHRSAVDPDNEDDNNYSADKTKNPKKLRKQKAMGESAAWTKKSGKSEAGGLNEKGRKSYERENPGSDLKAPSKKVGNPRRASFCSRMSGMKAKLTSKKTANDPDSRINKSLRAWNC